MADQVGDYVVRRLREWGVEQVFGYPGDGINGLVAAFGRADDKTAFIQARHEEMAAFQATGYAKFSGRVGVCTATSGPGAIHLLNGLYDAKLDPTMIGMRYPTEVNLVGDARTTLDKLIPLLTRKQDRSWRQTIEQNVARWWQTIERQSMLEAKPVNPMRVVWELSRRIPDDAIVTADSGSSTNWYARCLRMHGRMRGSLSGTLATMGPGVPYAIGAKFAHPDKPTIALVGDGSMQMNGLAELLTIARYYHRWSDRRLIVCVFHNNDLNQVTWELRAMGGAPKFEESQTLPEVSYAGFARSAGLEGIAVDNPDELGADGIAHWARIDRWCSTSAAIRKCRRTRRTPPGSR